MFVGVLAQLLDWEHACEVFAFFRVLDLLLLLYQSIGRRHKQIVLSSYHVVTSIYRNYRRLLLRHDDSDEGRGVGVGADEQSGGASLHVDT